MALPKGNSGHGMFVTIGCEDRAKGKIEQNTIKVVR
jgi:hypothetical protein